MARKNEQLQRKKRVRKRIGASVRGSIHDVQYLFAGIRSLLIRNGTIDEKNYVEILKDEIMKYNNRIAEKYNLRKPREIGDKAIKDVINELKGLNIIILLNGNFQFTETGNYLATLMRDGRLEEFRMLLTKLMLNRYHQLRFFLKRIYELSGGYGEIVIPRVSSRLFYEKYRGDVEAFSKYIIQRTSKSLLEEFRSKLSSAELTQKLRQRIKTYNTKVILRKIQVQAEQYLVSHMFEPYILNKRTYDVARDLCASLFLVNFGLVEEDGLPVEVVYLISWLKPFMKVPSTVTEVSEIELDDKNMLIINSPGSVDFRKKMIKAIIEGYDLLLYKAVLRFVRIYDLRNVVCRKLRISDRVFDEEFVRIYEEFQEGFSWDYAFETFTSKKMPMVLGKPIGGVYNLVKINKDVVRNIAYRV